MSSRPFESKLKVRNIGKPYVFLDVVSLADPRSSPHDNWPEAKVFLPSSSSSLSVNMSILDRFWQIMVRRLWNQAPTLKEETILRGIEILLRRVTTTFDIFGWMKSWLSLLNIIFFNFRWWRTQACDGEGFLFKLETFVFCFCWQWQSWDFRVTWSLTRVRFLGKVAWKSEPSQKSRDHSRGSAFQVIPSNIAVPRLAQ